MFVRRLIISPCQIQRIELPRLNRSAFFCMEWLKALPPSTSARAGLPIESESIAGLPSVFRKASSRVSLWKVYQTLWIIAPWGNDHAIFGYRDAVEGMNPWPCLEKKRPKIPTLCGATPSILGPCLGQAKYNDDNRATSYLVYAKFRPCGDSHKIIYPFQDGDAKSHGLSSDTSLDRLHKGVLHDKYTVEIAFVYFFFS